jgi:hypothetical protein
MSAAATLADTLGVLLWGGRRVAAAPLEACAREALRTPNFPTSCS